MAVGGAAQQPAMPVIGFLSIASPETWETYVAGFKQGLAQAGLAALACRRGNRIKGLVRQMRRRVSSDEDIQKTKGELDEPTYNVRRDGVGSNILLLTWI